MSTKWSAKNMLASTPITVYMNVSIVLLDTDFMIIDVSACLQRIIERELWFYNYSELWFAMKSEVGNERAKYSPDGVQAAESDHRVHVDVLREREHEFTRRLLAGTCGTLTHHDGQVWQHG